MFFPQTSELYKERVVTLIHYSNWPLKTMTIQWLNRIQSIITTHTQTPQSVSTQSIILATEVFLMDVHDLNPEDHHARLLAFEQTLHSDQVALPLSHR